MYPLARPRTPAAWVLVISLALALPVVAAPAASGAGAYRYAFAWGGTGTGPGAFNYPSAISSDAQGNLYVGDYYNNRVQKFTGTGSYLMRFGTSGPALKNVHSTAVDGAGNVYVGTGGYGATVIQKYAPGGTYLSSFPVWSAIGYPYDTEFDATGRLLAVGTRSDCVHVFDASGAPLGVFGQDVLFGPVELAAGPSDGRVLVADMIGIATFDADGTFTGRLPVTAPPYGFKGLALNERGEIFASGRGHIARYDADGGLKAKFAPDAGEPNGTGVYDYRGMCLLPSGKLYVTQVDGLYGVKVYEPVNLPPVADAGPDLTVRAGETFVLDGSSSEDPDGTIVSARWHLPGGTVLEGLTVQAVCQEPGVHEVTLTVWDDAGAEASDTMLLTAEEVVEARPGGGLPALRASVADAPIPVKGVRNSLLVKLDHALADVDRGDTTGAARRLRTFVSEVGALPAKQLDPALARQWRSEAAIISAALDASE
ncbi:MAG: PKD domain-containing protein [Coriobacteriia bacterium]|nr:PKD domain-containing protein [Coriobacteriia bacterium]